MYAAGNYGGQDGYFSITSPGMCKNSVSVGSSRSSTASFEELGDFLGIEVCSPRSWMFWLYDVCLGYSHSLPCPVSM